MVPSLITDVILIEMGLAFLLLVSVVLYRYSVNIKFRYWAIGWAMFGLGTLISIMQASIFTSFVDVIALSLVSVSALVILIASKGQIGMRDHHPIYAAALAVILLFGVLSASLSLPIGLPYLPVELLLAYACLSTVAHLLSPDERLGLTGVLCLIGFLGWGLSSFLYIVSLAGPNPLFAVAFQSTAFIWAGASMMAYYIQLMDSASRMQYEISEVMSHLIQHDIRNYVQTASLALEAHSLNDSLPDSLLKVASRAMEEAVVFIEKMRQVSVSLSRVESGIQPILVTPLVQNAVARVQREYSVEEGYLKIQIPEAIVVNSNPLAEELFWNIIDNAVKQGSQTVEITCLESDERWTTIQVVDFAGGVSPDVLDYLNAPMKNSRNSAPGKGLGLILIKRLSELCGAKTRALHTLAGDEVVGTTFRVILSTSSSTSFGEQSAMLPFTMSDEEE